MEIKMYVNYVVFYRLSDSELDDVCDCADTCEVKHSTEQTIVVGKPKNLYGMLVELSKSYDITIF